MLPCPYLMKQWDRPRKIRAGAGLSAAAADRALTRDPRSEIQSSFTILAFSPSGPVATLLELALCFGDRLFRSLSLSRTTLTILTIPKIVMILTIITIVATTTNSLKRCRFGFRSSNRWSKLWGARVKTLTGLFYNFSITTSDFLLITVICNCSEA